MSNSHQNSVVIGASGGIGNAIAHQLGSQPGTIYRCARNTAGITGQPENAVVLELDITSEQSVSAAAECIGRDGVVLDQVFISTGILQTDAIRPEKSLRQFDPDSFLQVMTSNALGPALVAKYFLPLMRRDGPAFFGALSARVGSIGDNRLGGWHSYRASKAALNMIIRNLAIEYRRTHPQLVIAGLHPGTVDTALSAPFQKNVPDGKLFSAERAATALLAVAGSLTPEDSGHCFAWDGKRIEP
jgi:NAD(P)-dependent dehydrogenase (short-subunit alcohol dehydrogenase family)